MKKSNNTMDEKSCNGCEVSGEVTWNLREKLLLAFSLIPGAAFLSMFLWRSGWDVDGAMQFSLFDDAMISMSYARTLAEGLDHNSAQYMPVGMV